jgi:hypothetical protein
LPDVCWPAPPLAAMIGTPAAFASSSVWWGLTSGSWPAELPLGPCGTAGEVACGKIVLTAENLGYAATSVEHEGIATPVVIKDLLPSGVRVIESKGAPEIEGVAGERPGRGRNRGPVECQLAAAHEVQCEFRGVLSPYEEIEVRIAVEVMSDEGPLEANSLNIAGGAAAPQTLTRSLNVGGQSGFGVENFEMRPEEEGGRPAIQAGGHPFQFTSVLAIDAGEAAVNVKNQEPAAMVKDVTIALPPGLLGNPVPFPQCTDEQFNSEDAEQNGDQCAPETAIGVVTVTTNQGSINTNIAPLFNLVPLAGEPARFGFEVAGFHVVLDVSVASGGNYGVKVKVSNASETAGVLVSKVTLWGVPGDPRHDSSRGWACIEGGSSCAPLNENEPPPFLSMPTACSGPMPTTVQVDSWAEPKPREPFAAPLFKEYTIGSLSGCNHLQFSPSIKVVPDVPNASTPTGMAVDVHVPQTAVLNPEGLAESALRDTTVALPTGVVVNAGGADGLEACSEGQIGFMGFADDEPTGETALFTEGLPLPREPGVNFCPNGSKIATVEIATPLLRQPLTGAMYLASQDANPFGSLIAMYLVAEDPVSGTVLKLAGEVALSQQTGQLVATFDNTPQLPFEDLRLHFFGESRAPLGTPSLCGPYVTNATFVPWSGNQGSEVSSSFGISAGPGGSPCESPLPFTPSLTAGTVSNQAAGFSNFTTTLSRRDGEQNLTGLELHMPPGFAGVLTGVALCGEFDANQGTCGTGSLIGEATVSVGVGESPYTVRGGRVYLTGPYRGAPFGLAIVVPTKAGPFTLAGNTGLATQVVRAKVEVDPHTAALTVTSDPVGDYAIPAMIEGIPLEVQHVNVTIDRPRFSFNPTSCAPLRVTGAITGTEDATAHLAVPFQATDCAALKFEPKFAVATSGRTSRAMGARLVVKLSYPNAALGTQTNIARVKVQLPKRLPSRLTTLQKACLAAQFARNPAGCPVGSIVGYAKAVTPIIPVALEGPAYFVSHGGEAFPSLIVVLQGYGVTVELVGATSISKDGVTSSTFKTIPDVPVGSFELTLPQGRYSALAATGSLCAGKLLVPTQFVAQDGAEIKTNTRVAVTRCPKRKGRGKFNKARRARAHRKAARRRKEISRKRA